MRARYRCEYCLVHEDDVLIPHDIDHIIAVQHGGATTAENLAFACVHCNRRKGPNIASIDLETEEVTPLFHPRKHIWDEHFELHSGHISPRTPIGRATVYLLSLNAAERIRVRENLIASGRYP